MIEPSPPEPTQSEPPLLVAIDGPVASGKTVVGRALAARLGWGMFDTGIMYRALTWLALERGVGLDDEVALAELARDADVRIVAADGGAQPDVQIELDGVNASPYLRQPHVEAAVSIVAAVAAVRSRLVRLQSKASAGGQLVVVGRDIGTVVLPDAPVKIFLTATDKVRARRRSAEAGQAADNDERQVLQQTRCRDAHDINRATSPLEAAADAVVLDTSELSLREAIAAAYAIVEQVLPNAAAAAR